MDLTAHLYRVYELSVAMGKRLRIETNDLKQLAISALLHDIGKVKVPIDLLNSKKELTKQEMNEIRKHVVYGTKHAKEMDLDPKIIEGILYHHERYDGTGYPSGLKGEQIPLFARIIAITDAYDAMTSDRVYQTKLIQSTALEDIKRNKGLQFDPNLVDIFISMINNQFKDQ